MGWVVQTSFKNWFLNESIDDSGQTRRIQNYDLKIKFKSIMKTKTKVNYSGGTKKAWTCLLTVHLGAFYFIDLLQQNCYLYSIEEIKLIL